MLKYVLALILMFGFICSVWFCISFFSAGSSETTPATQSASALGFSRQEESVATDPKPSRLAIPRINVDTILEHVGATSEGAVGGPVDPSRAAWFTLGPRPGEKGTAIVSGHFGWKNEIPAVFDKLSALQIGDPLYIEDQAGTVVTFVVWDIRTYELDSDDDYLDVFYSNDESSYLNLITCSGIWNEIEKNYPNRLVVFTKKE